MDKQALPKSRTALLMVDFINPLDFPGAKELTPHALVAAKNAQRLRMQASRAGVPVIYANDNFGSWHSDFKALVERLLKKPGACQDLAKLIRPKKGDLTVLKPMHSAFFGSPLEVILDLINAKEVIIAGLATDMCVQFTAMDAYLRGYEIWIPEDCTAAESLEAKAAALSFMSQRLKCHIHASSDDVFKLIN